VRNMESMENKSKEIMKGFDGWGYGGILITLILTLLVAIDSSRNPKGTFRFVMNFMSKSMEE
jgi:hypothetical protein